MLHRIIVLLFGLVLAYFAVMFGESVAKNFLYWQEISLSKNASGSDIFASMFLFVISSTLTVMSGFALLFITIWASDGFDPDSAKPHEFSASAALVVVSAGFGMFARPFANHGLNPLDWIWSPLSVFEIYALAPMIFSFKHSIEGACPKKKEDNVTTIADG